MAWVVLLPIVSIMWWFGFIAVSLASWAAVPRSVFMALSKALFPEPLSPVIRTMSVGRILSETLSYSVKRCVLSVPSPNASETCFVRSVCVAGAVS